MTVPTGEGMDLLIPGSKYATEFTVRTHDGELPQGREDGSPGESTLGALFAARVRRAPGAPAVEDASGRVLSYAALDARADRLSRRLRGAGVGPESRVGVCMERSAELVVALLGIVRAGAAYVPLDPAYPAERLAFMLEDAGVSALVTGGGAELPAALARFTGPVVSVAADEDEGGEEVAVSTTLTTFSDPGSLAYVVYTSGSTGTPKGIAIPHRGVVRLVVDTDFVRLGDEDRVAQVSNASFDAATFEIWGPLLNGGTVVVLPREVTLSPRGLAETLSARRITTLFLTTALFNQVARELPGAFGGLTHLLFGGEACDPAAVRRVLRAGPPRRLLHVYGPTESTTFATWQRVRRVEDGARTVPIGGPVARTSAFVLDAEMRPVAVGQTGELYLGGDGLARGYPRRAGLTAEKFVPSPFGGGERLYRTGDVVRLLDESGAVEFVGRADQQVKIRGFRIEPGEIEQTLLRHPAVRDAVVLAPADATGERRLVAYVVPASPSGDEAGTEAAALRGWLGERLPDYMVPAAFVALESFPLNPNGKVDRAALPEPSPSSFASVDPAGSGVEPRTATEAAVAEIFREVLGVGRIGVEDDFYALGGHSLRAIQVSARIRDALGVELSPVRVLEDARTVAALAGMVDAAAGEARAQSVAIPPAPRDRPVPLSYAQEAVWFFQQISPGLRSYNFQATLEFTGTLDVPALERALSELVARHEIFRTVFPADTDGQPFQQVHEPWAVHLPVTDLRDLGEEEREAELKRQVEAEFARPFSLSELPLIRWALFQMSDSRHVLAQVEHHFVHDGWSFSVFLREVLELYRAFARGEASPLSGSPLQFADYAAWQRQWMRGPEAAAQLAFWKQRLAGLPPVLELPTDRARPAEITFHGASHRVVLPPRLAEAARDFGRRRGASLYAVMLAAFQALLSRYAGQEEFAVGGSLANRHSRELEGMIGMVVNTVALRADLSGEPTFEELLGRVRRTVLEAQAHGEVPFDRVVDAVQPERSLSHLPIYQVAFSFHQAAMPSMELPGGSLRITEGHNNGSAKFDLSVVTIPRAEQRAGGGEGAVEMIWEFNRDLFDPATVRRMVDHFIGLLDRAVSTPAVPVSALPVADRGEALRLASGEASDLAPACLHQLFEEQAARAPHAVAVVHEGRSLTYGELDARANRLASRLVREGVRAESPVGILLPRSPEMVVAMLGVLKAGGAYLPLDPEYPAERIAFMLEESGAPVVVSDSTLAKALPAAGARVVEVDGPDTPESDETPQVTSEVSPASLAYVIYTSGSTGRPKGVMVPHAAVAGYVRGAARAYGITPADRVLQFASASFDISVEEIFTTLSAGATLVLRSEEMLGAPADFLRLCGERGVTAVSLPTAFWHAVAAGAEADSLPIPESLRLVVIGGERALAGPVGQWMRASGGRVPVVNTYGPTETTVVATAAVLGPDAGSDASPIPIGRPVADARAYVLDAWMRPAAIGVPGELYVGGPGVARGYLGRPGMTAERFVPDPFSPLSGARMYRTGDRVRWREDGTLEYLGRLDEQVKVRGFRIEPGEVEQALRALEGVGDCAVVAREDEPGRRRLVAYVVPAGDAARLDTSELRTRLRERLPDYMVPGAFVTLGALPRTPGGKTDRRALPAPGGAGAAPAGFVAPRNATEAALAEAWRALLGVSRVGVHENFFELGGDSILALQVVARAARLGVHVTPRQLFQHQTVAELAAVAGTGPAASAEQGRVTGDVPLTPVQRWFFEMMAEDGAPRGHWNQAMTFEAAAPVDAAALEKALRALAGHHDALRMRFERTSTGWRQHHAATEDAPLLRVVSLAGIEDEGERERLVASALEDAQASLDLARGPLLRAVLVERGESQPARVMVTAHHLVVDGVSWRVLREDLDAAYRQLRQGGPVVLPRKTTSFRDWAHRLSQYAHSGALRGELAFWEETAGARGEIPVDFVDGENTEGRVRDLTETLDRETTGALLRDAPARHRARVDEVLLAAFGRTLAAWTGAPTVLVDAEGHGREPLFDGVDLSRTVGWFTSLYPVPLDVGGVAPAEAVARVRERLRAMPNRGIGHGMLRHLSGDAEVEARLAALPQAQVVFNYLGRIDASAGGEGDGALRIVAADPGPQRSPGSPRKHLLEVTGRVLDGELRVTWRYAATVHSRETIERLAREFGQALREMARPESARRAAVPQDFPLANLSPGEMEWLAVSYAPDGTTGTLGDAVEDVYPLTPTQQGLLFHTREAAPGSGVYVVQAVWEMRGEMDAAAFARAWEETTEHHPALRTAFAWEGLALPLQVVLRRPALPFATHDWRGMPSTEREARLGAWLRDDRQAGFALSDAPPLRLTLFRVGDDEHHLVLTEHHLLLDGWSHALVLREVFARYAALRGGRAPRVTPARPFRDYLAWTAGRDESEAERFWRAALEGFSAPTPLPLDRGRTPSAESNDEAKEGGGALTVRLTPEATAALNGFARAHRLTLGTLVQAAWALTLARYAGEDDVLFGAVSAGRPAEMEGAHEMVGLFASTLPVRVQADPASPLVPWLRGIQEQQAEARRWEHAPLVRVRQWSAVPGNLPLFETLLALENYPVSRPGANPDDGGLRLAGLRAEEQTNYPLTVVVRPGEALALRFLFDPARIGGDGAARVLEHFRATLAALGEGAAETVGALPGITAEERRRVVHAWSGTASAYPRDASIHRLFEEQAARTPDAVALVFGAEHVTYAELNRRANRLARRLRARGVTTESRVGLAVERSAEMVVALLAILKAGGAYVPLDASYPAERLAAMLEDAHATTLVVRGEVPEALQGFSGTVVSAASAESDAEEGDANLDGGDVPAGALAYVVFTSGSTGRPKGVAVPHRAVCRLVRETDYVDFGPEHVFLQLAPVAFDASTFEVWGPLLNGARLVVHPPHTPTLAELGDAIRAHGVTTLWLTAGLFSRVVDENVRALGGLRQLLAGGDVLSVPHVRRVLEALPGLRLVNGYGPTENTTFTACHAVRRQDAASGGIPLGRPIANTRVYVLDDALRPVPAGAPGELYAGGDGLARGYLGRPGATAAAFVPDPFSAEPGARLYRTGDRARWTAEGTLEFLGRADEQAKVRGFRVEPGEVEAALLRHPEVRSAAVAAVADASGERVLAAYVVPRDGRVDPAELRAFLRERLPAPLVPTAWSLLDALPLTPNGKVDRRALPALAAPPAETDQAGHTAPRTPTETALAAIFAEVLGVERVGVDDDFFLLGGHSLRAMQVASRVRDRLGADLPLRAVFEHPTVAALATRIAGGSDEELLAMIQELEGLSDEEARRLLEGEDEG